MEAATTTTPEMLARAEFVQGLRDLADWLDAHPEIEFTNFRGSHILWYRDTREQLADAARALGRVEKTGTDSYFNLTRRFGPHEIEAYSPRATVCERVVVGKKAVPVREIPEDKAEEAKRLREQIAALEVERVAEVDEVEWRCEEPLLAGGANG